MQYPLGEHEREQIASKTGKKLDEITLDAVMRNQIARMTLRFQKKCFMHRDRWQKKTAMIRWKRILNVLQTGRCSG